MNLKAAFALVLGLVLQLGLVAPGASAIPACAVETESCACCADFHSCGCVTNDDGAPQAPSFPAPESAGHLKVPLARAGDPAALTPAGPGTASAAHASACPRRGPPAGFEGVRLSVAFCSFVI